MLLNSIYLLNNTRTSSIEPDFISANFKLEYHTATIFSNIFQTFYHMKTFIPKTTFPVPHYVTSCFLGLQPILFFFEKAERVAGNGCFLFQVQLPLKENHWPFANYESVTFVENGENWFQFMLIYSAPVGSGRLHNMAHICGSRVCPLTHSEAQQPLRDAYPNMVPKTAA